MSIRLKLIIVFLAIATIPLLLVSVLTFHNYKDTIEASQIHHLENTLAFKVDKIETYFANLKVNAEITQNSYVVRKNFPVLLQFADYQQNPEFAAAWKMLDETTQKTTLIFGLSDFMLVSFEGKVVYANKAGHVSKDFSSGTEVEKEAFGRGKDRIFLSDIYFDKDEANRYEMLVTAPALDFNGVTIGVIAFEVDMTSVYAIIQDTTGLGETGETLIGKKIGNQVVFLNPLRHDPNAALVRTRNIGDKAGVGIQNAVQGTGAGQYIDYRGEKVIGAWRYIPSLDWGMVAKIDSDEAFADVTNLRNLAVIILGIVIVLSGITAFSIAQSISEPIKRLSEGAEIIGSGNLDYKIGTNLKDEIGQLSRTFDKMTGDLKQTLASRDELNREVSERKRIQDELQLIIDAVPAMIFYKDKENHFVRTNKAFEDAMGMPKEKLEGKSLNDIYPKEQAEAYWNDDKEVIASGKAKYGIIESMQSAKGTRIVQTDKIPYFDKSGNVIGVIGFAIDITERKAAEEALRKSEEYFRALAEGLPSIVWTADAEGNLDWLNQRWYEYTGQDTVQGKGWGWGAVTHPDDLTQTDEKWKEAVRTRSIFENEVRVKRHDGEYRWFLVRAWPLLSGDGNVARWFGTNTDIHELKQLEAALRESQGDLSRAQVVGSIGSWRLDTRKNVLTWSDENHRIFGIPEGTPMTYETFLSTIHPDDREFVDTKWKAALAGEDYDIEHRIVVDGQIKWVREKAYLEFDNDNKLLGGFGITQDITGRKKMEEELRKSRDELEIRVEERTADVEKERRRMYDVLETLPAYVCLLTPDYYMPFANRIFREWFGYYPDKKCYEFLFNRKEPCEDCQTYTALKTNKPQRWEWTGPNGRNYDIFDFPFKDTDGSQLILEMGMDITEQKKAQEAVRSASLYSRGLLEAALDPLVTISPDGKITDVNEATIKVTGFPRKNLIGTDFSNYFTEPAKAQEGYQQVFAKGFVTDYPLTIRHRDGRLTDVLYNATVYKNEAGQIQGVFAAARDITEQKRAQEAVRSASLYTRGLIEASLDPLVTISQDGKITDVNKATELVTGAASDELIGTDFSNYFTEPKKAREGYRKVFADGFVTDYPLTIRHKDGLLTDVLYNATVYKNEAGQIQGVFAAARDITEKKAAEAELEKYRLHLEDLVKQRTAELARSNKDLEQFAYVASHDLQEPLRAVAGFVELLRRNLKGTLDDKTTEYIGFTIDGARRMQSLINGLLEYSRVGTQGKIPKKINSKEALDEATARLAASIKETGAEIIAEDLPIVYFDDVQLTQLFQNLIGNAIKFRSQQAPRIHISAVRQDSGWQFAVTDNGIGIESQYAQRIFQIFQRLHSRDKYPGTGIGLSICKKIVERHGGRIWVESTPGHGSTFYFTVPDIEGV